MIIASQHSASNATLQFTELHSQKPNTTPNQDAGESRTRNASNVPHILSRSRRDLQNPVAETNPFKGAIRSFADALVKQGDGQLAINLGHALVRRQLASENGQLIGDPYKLAVPSDSTFGQAWSELADALESEPFKSFAEAKLIDVTQLIIERNGDLSEAGSDGGFVNFFAHNNPEWSAVSGAVLAAARKFMTHDYPSVSFYGRYNAPAHNILEYYGHSTADLSSNNRLNTAAQLLRDGNFKTLSSTDPLDAPIKQKQREARQRIVDLPPSALIPTLEKLAPSTVEQKVQQADQALAQLVSRGMMKLMPETSDYQTSVALEDLPKYSTYVQTSEALLKVLNGKAATTFAQENNVDPTSMRINPVSGEMMGTVKGVNTTFTLNDVSGWNEVWTEIKDTVQRMAAGSKDDVTYPDSTSAPLYKVMDFYNEPSPHQALDATRQLASTLGRIDEMNQNQGFNAMVGAEPTDPGSIAVRQRQQAVIQKLVGTPLTLSPLETLGAAVKANLPAPVNSQESAADVFARAEGEMATTVHSAMLELQTHPEQVTSKIIQPIPPMSLPGQCLDFLNKALKGRGFTEWAREQNIDLASLRYDPTDKALIGKVKGVDQRFTDTDFALKHPQYFDALTHVLNAASQFAKAGQPLTLPHTAISGLPYPWIANLYSLSDVPGSTAFEQQTALMGRTQQFPTQSGEPQKKVAWLGRQKTALGDSNDRYQLIRLLKNWSANSSLSRFVVDPDSTHHPKSVTTVAAFLSHNEWDPIQSKADNDNLLAALQTQAPQSPPLGNQWGFLSTQLPLSTAQRNTVAEEVKSVIGANTTLLNYLGSGVTHLSKAPEQALEQLLTSDQAIALATHLQTKMQGASTPTSLKQWLLTALVLELDPTAGTQHKTVAGVDLMGIGNGGRGTRFINERFSQDLATRKAIPPHLAPVVSHLLLSGAAPHLLVKDVPEKVTLGSPEWFNFTAAVNQIEWKAPGASANMTYQQVMNNYNIQPISALEAQIKNYAQMNPLLDWAALNNKVNKNSYTLAQLKDSQQKLQAEANRTAEAVRWLGSTDAPNRRDMALKVLREIFGTDIDYEKRFMLESELGGIASGRHYSLVEIYEAGRLDEIWPQELKPVDFSFSMTTGLIPGLKLADSLLTSDKWTQDGKHVDLFSLHEKAKAVDLPVINDEFDKAIKADFNLRRRHTTTLFEDMLKKLPVEEGKSLLYGDVEFLNVEGAGSGMVITSVYNGVRRDFAVYPTWGQIVRIADIDPSTPLGQKVSLDIDAEAFKTGTEPKPGIKSDVVLRSTERRLLDDNNELWPLEVSFPAHKENDAFSPNYVSGRLSKLSKAMIDSTYLNKAEFVNLHRNWSSNTLETATEPSDFFKALWHSLPGASSLEDLYHGQFAKAGLDLAIDVAIVVATEGAGKLWGLAKTAASWGAAKVAAGFIEKFGAKEAESIALKDFTASTATQSTNALSRLQDSQITEQTADMANGSVLFSGAQEKAKITAILQEGKWYAYDVKTMAAYGPALEGFISDTSSILRQETFSDGTKALVAEGVLADDAYTIERTNGFDLINDGRVYRYNKRTPEVLTDLESADHFKTLDDFEALCPVPSVPGRNKRGTSDECFVKILNDVQGELGQELQALEHTRLYPSPHKSFLNRGRFTVFERKLYKVTETETGTVLVPTLDKKRINYNQRISGEVMKAPGFGFYGNATNSMFEEETRVVKLGKISEICNDQRELRGVVLSDANGVKQLVVEADTNEFYRSIMTEPPQAHMSFEKCEFSQIDLDLVKKYRNKLTLRQGRAGRPIDSNFVVLPKLKDAYKSLEKMGIPKNSIAELKSRCAGMTAEQQREVAYQLQKSGLTSTHNFALKTGKVLPLVKPEGFEKRSLLEQNRFYAQESKSSVRQLMDATGLGPSNLVRTPSDIARADAAQRVILWLRNTFSKLPANYSDLIIKSGVGNCGEMGILSADIINKSGGRAYRWEAGDAHAFTVVGGPSTRPLPTKNFSEPEWADAWIVDPWANISCPASQYTQKLQAVMNDWQASGLVIREGTNPKMSPLDKQWIETLIAKPKSPLKSAYK